MSQLHDDTAYLLSVVVFTLSAPKEGQLQSRLGRLTFVPGPI